MKILASEKHLIIPHSLPTDELNKFNIINLNSFRVAKQITSLLNIHGDFFRV